MIKKHNKSLLLDFERLELERLIKQSEFLKNKSIEEVIAKIMLPFVNYKIITRGISLDNFIDYKAEHNQVMRIIEDEATGLTLSIYNIEFLIQNSELQTEEELFNSMKYFISSLATQDPNKFHYATVRSEIISIKDRMINDHKYYTAFLAALDDSNTIDKLTRELVNFCKTLSVKLSNIKDDNIESDGMFIWDKIYLDILGNYGKQGQKAKKDLLSACLDSFKNYKINKIYSYSTWIKKTTDAPFYLSIFLKIVIEIIWEGKIKENIKFAVNNTLALTDIVQDPLKKILSPKNIIVTKDKRLQLIHQESIIGNYIIPDIIIPAISDKIYKQIFNGLKNLNTLTGHKLIRYLPTTAYTQKINGHTDWRLIKLERGATEIAEHLRLSVTKSIGSIKDILHAMAYCEFTDFRSNEFSSSGNLIQLTKFKSQKTHRYEGLLINVGHPLLPYQTFSNGGLLIPLLTGPPLVYPNQSHAAQYLLQMEIMGEFSKQSVKLFQDDFIEITQNKWQEFADRCNLTPEVLIRIQDRWTQDGNDAPKFLEKIDGNSYTLGREYQKELNFLKNQGKLRIKNSLLGKASAIKRKK